MEWGKETIQLGRSQHKAMSHVLVSQSLGFPTSQLYPSHSLGSTIPSPTTLGYGPTYSVAGTGLLAHWGYPHSLGHTC